MMDAGIGWEIFDAWATIGELTAEWAGTLRA
jgi:hypothetical protein